MLGGNLEWLWGKGRRATQTTYYAGLLDSARNQILFFEIDIANESATELASFGRSGAPGMDTEAAAGITSYVYNGQIHLMLSRDPYGTAELDLYDFDLTTGLSNKRSVTISSHPGIGNTHEELSMLEVDGSYYLGAVQHNTLEFFLWDYNPATGTLSNPREDIPIDSRTGLHFNPTREIGLLHANGRSYVGFVSDVAFLLSEINLATAALTERSVVSPGLQGNPRTGSLVYVGNTAYALTFDVLTELLNSNTQFRRGLRCYRHEINLETGAIASVSSFDFWLGVYPVSDATAPSPNLTGLTILEL